MDVVEDYVKLVFSAGALKTPDLIKKIIPEALTCEVYKKIGVGLAFHVSDFYLLYPKFRMPGPNHRVKILNGRLKLNLRKSGDAKYTVQSVGAPIKKEYVQRFILRRLPKNIVSIPLVKPFVTLLSTCAEWFGARAHVIATIVQDPMLEGNCVEYDPNLSFLKVHYSSTSEFKVSVNKIDKQLRNILKKKFFVVGLGGQGNVNSGHPMGGCAMGENENFPVDKTGRLKPMKNIYVADASVFPISGDTNPSLTISAVAFRTADQILKVI